MPPASGTRGGRTMRGLTDLQAGRDEQLQEYGFAHLEEAAGRDERRGRVVERKRKDDELATLFSSMLRGDQVLFFFFSITLEPKVE